MSKAVSLARASTSSLTHSAEPRLYATPAEGPRVCIYTIDVVSLDEIKKRASAHENSAEYHRSRDAKLGGATKFLSAIVGAGVFVGLVSKLGLDGKGSLSVPPGWEWLYWLVLAVSLAGPALAALQIHLHDADDAVQHRDSFAKYRKLEDDWERFLARNVSDPAEAERARGEFSERFYENLKSSISLHPRAKKEVGL